MEAQLQEIISKISQFVAAYFLLIIIIGSVPYVFKSYGIQKVGKRMNAKYLWLSWIPIMRYHIVSQIADVHRVSVGKSKKLTSTYEISTFTTVMLIIASISMNKVILLIPIIALLPLILYTQIFATYYFFRYCDKENATIFFVLGFGSQILNSIFFFNCRDKGGKNYYNIYR